MRYEQPCRSSKQRKCFDLCWRYCHLYMSKPEAPSSLFTWRMIFFTVLNRKRKVKENHARTYRFGIVYQYKEAYLPSICSRNRRFLTHSGANCVVSTEFHCAILTEETRIASKILFYQLSRQRQFSPIFCTKIPLEPARKLYRLGVLFTGENVRCSPRRSWKSRIYRIRFCATL